MIYKTLNIDIDYARIGTDSAGFQCTLTLYLPENSEEIDPKRRRPDISLAKRELDWQPRVSLDEGLEKTIAYFKQKLAL